MNELEGTMECLAGLLIIQLSILDIVNDKEEIKLKQIIRDISERNGGCRVSIEITLEEGKRK